MSKAGGVTGSKTWSWPPEKPAPEQTLVTMSRGLRVEVEPAAHTVLWERERAESPVSGEGGDSQGSFLRGTARP